MDIPAFSGATDLLNILYGMSTGAVSVLPDGSMMQLCKTNVTQLYPTYSLMVTKFSSLDISNGLLQTQYLAKYTSNALFNCYYSVVDPGSSSEYQSDMSVAVVGWNVLYNAGYMYTDVYSAVNNLNGVTADWYKFGQYLGDFIIRFIYSKYVPRDYYF